MHVVCNTDRSYLEHHGIKGQKWGVRRFQNPDGILTDVGKKRQQRLDSVKAKAKKLAIATGKIVAKTALKTAVATGVVAAGGAALMPIVSMFGSITMNTFEHGDGLMWTDNGPQHIGQGDIVASVVNTFANLDKYDWFDAYRN